jgi:hypothetical protein
LKSIESFDFLLHLILKLTQNGGCKMARRYWKFAAVFVGAALGFAYYKFIGCSSGTCPITSNPWISTGYGALLGLIFVWNVSPKKQAASTEEN